MLVLILPGLLSGTEDPMGRVEGTSKQSGSKTIDSCPSVAGVSHTKKRILDRQRRASKFQKLPSYWTLYNVASAF
jgi:hypothetical protein